MHQPRSLVGQTCLFSSLGCAQLDAMLRGGLACGSITELAGEATSGKTQLALQALLTVQLPRSMGGLEGSSMYVHTTGDPPLKRLAGLASKYDSALGVSLDHVLLQRGVSTGDELFQCLQMAQPMLQMRAAAGSRLRPVRLIVIDDIGSISRELGDNPGVYEYRQRSELLFSISGLLKRYADTFDLAVLIINQVVDAFDDSSGGAQSSMPVGSSHLNTIGSNVTTSSTAISSSSSASSTAPLVTSGRAVMPALGLAWSHCVNTRLFTARHDGPEGTARILQVVFSPHLPLSCCYFVVRQEGVFGVRQGQPEHVAQQLTMGHG